MALPEVGDSDDSDEDVMFMDAESIRKKFEMKFN